MLLVLYATAAVYAYVCVCVCVYLYFGCMRWLLCMRAAYPMARMQRRAQHVLHRESAAGIRRAEARVQVSTSDCGHVRRVADATYIYSYVIWPHAAARMQVSGGDDQVTCPGGRRESEANRS